MRSDQVASAIKDFIRHGASEDKKRKAKEKMGR